MDRKCNKCALATLREVGYSCYTIEGTVLDCSYHPDDGFDTWYGEEKKLAYAEKCEHFTPGDPGFEPYCRCEGECMC